MADDTPTRAEPASVARVPRATYRLQFNHTFTFRDAAEIVPYLRALGISDVYASPYLQARPGSLHGYDITDHARLNPEIGGEEEHARLSARLREHGMGQLLDIVPNHMGIGADNRWWWDVLENGPGSPYAPYFDIDWRPDTPELEGKVLLPVLGEQYGEVLERGELKLVYDEGAFRIEYFDHRFPAAPAPTAAVLRDALARLEGVLDVEHPDRMELESVAVALERLPGRRRTDPPGVAERRREKAVARRRLAALHAASPAVAAALDAAVAAFNGRAGDPRSFDPLDALLAEQGYRLAFWRVAAEEINYRRFFDVNHLAGVRVEVPRVFEDMHRLILRLVREGKVTGLRIDHPDGLFHPRGYLRDLQAAAAGVDARERFYVVVEKILTGDEELPGDWPVAGTVGYEFLNRLNGLFVAAAGEEPMDLAYRRVARTRERFEDLAYDRKRLILRTALVSELTVLTTLLSRLSEENRRSRDFTRGGLREALREVVACFPVYRTYIDAFTGSMTARDRAFVGQAVRRARRRNPSVSASIFEFIRGVLLLEWPESLDEAARTDHATFVMKFQQLTGPVMAKGVEDTAFYGFNRLVSLNEVGGEPDRFGLAPAALHRYLAQRARQWPHALSTTSTHDTKRAEDVRARVNVLSEIPDLWEEHATRWAELNRTFHADEEGSSVPDPNDEYLLYQTLAGAWPLEALDEAGHAAFVDRIRRYMEKATREAKVHTSWISPNEAYDEGLSAFVAAVLHRGENPFVEDFLRFHPVVARMGMVNSLAQTLVKLTAPGVPDVYQGQELWDFSLVDPDNRRPVDYRLRRRMLAELDRSQETADRRALAREMVARWPDGRVKLFLTVSALRLREARPEVFTGGEYLPLAGTGARAEHLFAFVRRGGGAQVLVAVPRLPATLMRDRGFALPDAEAWEGTRVEGEPLAGRWRSVLTGAEMEAGAGGLAAGALFADVPVALLEQGG